MSAALLVIVLMLVAFAAIRSCASSPIQVKFKIPIPNGLGTCRQNRFVRTPGRRKPGRPTRCGSYPG